jgi:hypothetical protein
MKMRILACHTGRASHELHQDLEAYSAAMRGGRASLLTCWSEKGTTAMHATHHFYAHLDCISIGGYTSILEHGCYVTAVGFETLMRSTTKVVYRIPNCST